MKERERERAIYSTEW